MSKNRLSIATSLVNVNFVAPAVGARQGRINVECKVAGNVVGFHASEHQQNYYANEVNYLLLNKPGATCKDVVDYMVQHLTAATESMPIASVTDFVVVGARAA